MPNILVFVLLFALCFAIAFPAEIYTDIPYYPDGTAPQPDKNLLDIYVPDSAGSDTPVFFWIHGGMGIHGDKDEYAILGQNIADQEGYVSVIISYRFSDSLHPEVVHPDHITDVARAFAWTKEHIAEYGGDPNRIFICGQSAGGHLCALLFTNTAYLEAEGLSDDDIFGAMPISIALYDAWTYVIGGEMITAYQPAFDSDSAIWYDASPKYFLHGGMPPTRIFVAQDDPANIRLETARFYNDMNEYQPTETIFVDGGHISEVYDLIHNPDSRIRRQIVGFMDEVISASVKETPKMPDSFIISVSPNPFNSSCVITLSCHSRTPVCHSNSSNCHSRENGNPEGRAVLEIYDLRGNVVWQTNLSDNKKRPQQTAKRGGSSRLDGIVWIPDKSITSGIYFVRVIEATTSVVGTKRIVYIK